MHYSTDGEQKVEKAVCALGWISLAIGVTEFFAADAVQRWMGLDERPRHRGILQILGVREILHGVSLLASAEDSERIRASLWGRVAGDVLDGALLGAAAMRTKSPGGFAAIAAMVAPVMAADMIYAIEAEREPQALPQRLFSRVRG
jgi:hypothetical protein